MARGGTILLLLQLVQRAIFVTVRLDIAWGASKHLLGLFGAILVVSGSRPRRVDRVRLVPSGFACCGFQATVSGCFLTHKNIPASSPCCRACHMSPPTPLGSRCVVAIVQSLICSACVMSAMSIYRLGRLLQISEQRAVHAIGLREAFPQGVCS